MIRYSRRCPQATRVSRSIPRPTLIPTACSSQPQPVDPTANVKSHIALNNGTSLSPVSTSAKSNRAVSTSAQQRVADDPVSRVPETSVAFLAFSFMAPLYTAAFEQTVPAMRSKCAKIGHWFFRCLTSWLFDLTGGTTYLNTLLNIPLLLMRASFQLPGWNSFTPGSTEERTLSIGSDGIYDTTEVLLLCFPRFPLLLFVNHVSIILDSSATILHLSNPRRPCSETCTIPF